jgi:hypothetical protein
VLLACSDSSYLAVMVLRRSLEVIKNIQNYLTHRVLPHV